jgi:hypothetical protein
MSKLFFTKYLPIEGEIAKYGEKVIDESGDVSVYKYSELNTTHGNLKKTKLFLCSRDIEVGDKVLDEEFCEWIVQDSDLKALYLLTKVIGEISPEATWVKEGDEFDEEQIQFRGCLQNLCLIKGPCGHFH